MACNPISVLVTGASRGLGLEFVKQIVETQGPLKKLFATCRNPDKAEDLQCLADKHPNLIKIISMDASDPKSIKQAAALVGSEVGEGGLNLLINNAAIAALSTFMKSTVEEMQSCYNTNVVGPMCIIQEFHPCLRMAAQDSGIKGMCCRKAAVVNISSLISSIGSCKGLYTKWPGAVAYRSSKSALNMIMVCASVELEKDEILCALLHPGWVRTSMGGPDGDIDAPESVQKMLKVMKCMDEKHSGELVDYEGKTIPW